MEDYKETMLEMIRGNKIMIDSYLSSNPSDKTKKGVVKKTGFSKYSVEVEGKIYDDIPTIGGTCVVNEVVRVMIPQNQYSNMFIIKGATEAELTGGLDTKVDKVIGKELSSNDFTDSALIKLNGIEEGANKTIVDSSLSATSLNPVQNKVIDSVLKNIVVDLSGHISDKNNPHDTTSTQVGLGNVPNVSTNNQTPTWNIHDIFSNIISGETLSVIFGKIEKAILNLINHINNITNPHSVTKSQVGLGNVDNTSDINKIISNDTQMALNTKLDLSGGIMSGNINMGLSYIDNLAPAITNNQAVSLKQLTDSISGLGTVFDLKGSKPTIADLPNIGNKIGDVWYVESESVGYIWLQDTQGILRWEKFGQEIDLSGYLTKVDLLQTTGQIINNTMSQKAITDQLSLKPNKTDLATTTINGLMSSQDKVKLNGIQNGAEVNSVLGVKGSSESIYRIGNISLSKSDIGLGNVDNTSDINKPISNLTQTELNKKANSATLAKVATSGSYNDLVNKPIIPNKTSQLTNDSNFVADANYVHTDNNFTSGYLNKLNGIQNGAEVNVNSDWNATSGDALILNKPNNFRNITLAELNDGNLTSGIYNIQKISLASVGIPNSSFAHVFVGGGYTSGGFGSQIAISYQNGFQTGVWYRTAHINVYPIFSRIDDYNNLVNKPTSLPAKGGNADTAIKLLNERTINGVPFDGTNNIQVYDDTKSAYTKSFFNGTDATKRYFKICTIRNEGTYSNGQVEFEIMNRRFFSAKVNLSLRSGNDRIMNGILKVSGNDYGREFIRAFRYIGSDNVSYVEIWGTLVPWDSLNVYTKTINMYGTSIIWNNQRYDNYPADFEIEIRKRYVGEISYDKREPVYMSTGDVWYQEL